MVVRPSDAGLLPIREFDQRIGLTEQFSSALTDPRYQPSIAHTLREMVRVLIFGILADYPDQNDHDVLRSDPIFKILAGRSPEGDDLASQPTLSRFENAIDVKSLGLLQEVLVDQFIASFDEPPTRITLDIDPFDDPTHGQQQLTFFHGYYQQYQYLSRVITCAENDLVVMLCLLCLLFGTAHAALGAGDDLAYLVGRLRDAFPGVRIILRADIGTLISTRAPQTENGSLLLRTSLGSCCMPRRWHSGAHSVAKVPNLRDFRANPPLGGD